MMMCVWEKREHWQSGPENHAHGIAWLDQVYKQNRTATISTFAAHKDFGNSVHPFLCLSLLT